MPIEDMVHPFLKFYTAAPQWIKSSLGQMYALAPASLRYGAKYHEFAGEIARSGELEWLHRRADEKLMETLRWAIDTVPANAALKPALARGDSASALLAAFPLLSKEDLKADPGRYLSTRMGPETHLMAFTGGSTSVPMKLYLEKYVSRSKDFAYNSSFDQIAGVGRTDIILALRGRTVPGAGRPDGSLWMFDPIKRYLHLSSDHLEPAYMPRYVEALRKWKPGFIHAFPSALVPLARWLKANPAPDITSRIRAIQLFSENIYDYQVDLLKEVFGCPVLLDYGHSERAVKAISAPGDARYFFWPLYGKVELVDTSGRSIDTPGVLGEIVATGFDNRVMPLIRYRTGDLAMWSAAPNTTRPGFPVVERIEGRLQEFLVCHDHRLVSICTIGAAHFEQLASADRMQFEQSAPGKATLKVLSSSELTKGAREALAAGIHAKTQGGITVEIVRVDEIRRSVSGKHKLLLQHLDISTYLGAAHLDSEGTA
jgi:phenylacetate-CoA ligase